jgi:tetratricopeptide (TPR) repeat protein
MNRIQRLIDSGQLPQAYAGIEKVLQRCVDAGENAYPGAAFDIARAYFLLGRVLRMGGQAGAALAPLAEAGRRFEALAAAGDAGAVRMASAAITEGADCLAALGRLDDAAEAYQRAILLDKKRGDMRDVAVGNGQLGTVRMLQRRYADALAAWAEARGIFERLGEPAGVATAWHQIGVVHKRAGNAEAAERAYRQALAIEVQQGNRAGQASSLGELGNLYDALGRLEEAVAFYRQAADIHVALGDGRYEGVDHNNIADTLVKLRRYDEARAEILRAIECDRPFGHAAEPWKTWGILHRIEQALGDAAAARAAWRQARDAYLAYRREGGYAQGVSGKLGDALWQAVQQGGPAAGAALLRQVIQREVPGTSEVPGTWRIFQSILAGARDPALAGDPALYYGSAAEVALLLERLGG